MNRKTRRAIEETARAEGAIKIEWQEGRKHHLVRFHMPDGRVASMTVSAGTGNDEYKVRGWTRQFIRNPSRQSKS